MDEWLIRTVITLYTEVCTVVRTDAGLSESFHVKVGLYQGAALSPHLFAAVMTVVSSEAKSGLPSKFLYADDLVLMAAWHGCTSHGQISAKHNTQIPGPTIYTENPD